MNSHRTAIVSSEVSVRAGMRSVVAVGTFREDAARRLDDLEDSIRRQAMVARATDHGRAYTWDRSTDEMEGVLERFARRDHRTKQ